VGGPNFRIVLLLGWVVAGLGWFVGLGLVVGLGCSRGGGVAVPPDCAAARPPESSSRARQEPLRPRGRSEPWLKIAACRRDEQCATVGAGEVMAGVRRGRGRAVGVREMVAWGTAGVARTPSSNTPEPSHRGSSRRAASLLLS
jgi:hypothetical protein